MTAAAWLRGRIRSAPPRLLETMLSAIPQEGMASVPEALAEGAVALYAEVAQGSGGREDALALLAADALFTHAFQAQAELEPEGLAAFAARWAGAGPLAEIAR